MVLLFLGQHRTSKSFLWVRVELHVFVWFLPAGGSTQRTVLGFVERRHKDAIQERLELQKAEREVVKPGEARAERGGARGLAGAGLRAQRSLSPESHRSSSLPPAHRNGPPTTPSTCPPKTTVQHKHAAAGCLTETNTCSGHLADLRGK